MASFGFSPSSRQTCVRPRDRTRLSFDPLQGSEGLQRKTSRATWSDRLHRSCQIHVVRDFSCLADLVCGSGAYLQQFSEVKCNSHKNGKGTSRIVRTYATLFKLCNLMNYTAWTWIYHHRFTAITLYQKSSRQANTVYEHHSQTQTR